MVGPERTSIRIEDGARHVIIRLGPEGTKQLGALQMPSTEVKFTFVGFTPSRLDEFWRLFDLSYRRGGG